MTPETLDPPDGYLWQVSTVDNDGVTLYVALWIDGETQAAFQGSWPLTPRDLAKQERIEARIRACKRALLRKYAENKRIEAAIHAS